MQNNQLRKNNKGVTLVEVIAVIAALGVVMAAVTGFMITSARMSAQVSNAATVTGRQQAAVEFINQRLWAADKVVKNDDNSLSIDAACLETIEENGEKNITYNGVYLCDGEISFEAVMDTYVTYVIEGTLHTVPLKNKTTSQAAVRCAMDFIDQRLQEAVIVELESENILLIDKVALTTQSEMVTYNGVPLCDGEIRFVGLNEETDTVEYFINNSENSRRVELIAKKAAEVVLDAATTYIAEKFASVGSANVSISEGITIEDKNFAICKIADDNPEDDNPVEEFLFQTVLDEFGDPIVVCNDKKICEGTICFVESIDNNTVTYFLNEIKYEASLKTTETEPPAAGASEQE